MMTSGSVPNVNKPIALEVEHFIHIDHVGGAQSSQKSLFITFVSMLRVFTIRNVFMFKPKEKKTFEGCRFVFKVDTLTVNVKMAILVFI